MTTWGDLKHFFHSDVMSTPYLVKLEKLYENWVRLTLFSLTHSLQSYFQCNVTYINHFVVLSLLSRGMTCLQICRWKLSNTPLRCRLSCSQVWRAVFHFHPRDASYTRVLAVVVSVCPSVRLSQVVLKRLNVGSRKKRHMYVVVRSPRDSNFLLPKILAKLKRDHPQRKRQMQVEWVKMATFDK